MGWQPKSKQKRKCPRCGESFYLMQAAGGASVSLGSLIDGAECPKCRKLRGKLLTRPTKNQPPESGK